MQTLQVTLQCGEGCLRRLLGLIEGRGFVVETLSLVTLGAEQHALLSIAPRDGARCVAVLARQIDRLRGVEAAVLDAGQAQQVFLASHGRGMHWA